MPINEKTVLSASFSSYLDDSTLFEAVRNGESEIIERLDL